MKPRYKTSALQAANHNYDSNNSNHIKTTGNTQQPQPNESHYFPGSIVVIFQTPSLNLYPNLNNTHQETNSNRIINTTKHTNSSRVTQVHSHTNKYRVCCKNLGCELIECVTICTFSGRLKLVILTCAFSRPQTESQSVFAGQLDGQVDSIVCPPTRKQQVRE